MKRLILTAALLLLAGLAFGANYDSKWTLPPDQQQTITNSDSTVYDPPLVAVYTATGGDVRFILSRDLPTTTCANAPVHTLPATYRYSLRIKQVCSTGSVAADLIGYPSDDRR